MSNETYRVREEEVAAKVMDGEAIIINLTSGVYYSLDGVGCAVWERLAAGMRPSEICRLLAEQYRISTDAVQKDVGQLLAQLQEENLIEPTDGALAIDARDAGIRKSESVYEQPKLRVYRDMGALLALDPPMPGLKDIPWQDSVE